MLMRSGMIVLAANLVEVFSALLRNVILARLLTVEQFGIAATFAILMTLIEAFQNIGLNRMIVQDRRADDPHFMASLHGAQLAVGAFAGLLMIGLAWVYAFGMGTPELLGAYMLMAAIPLINGLIHLETFRAQRQGRFMPQALRSLLSQPVGLLAVFPGYWWLGDYRTVLVAIFAQQLTAAILTHVAVRERFVLAFDRAIWRRAFTFGWPLTVNGVFMFWVLNGDRMVIFNQFGATTLGWFSAALMLTVTPTNMIAKTLQTITLPMLARSQDDQRRFQQIFDASVSAIALLVVAMALTMLLIGKYFLLILFGANYLPATEVLAYLACMSGLRLMRAVPVVAAMARGETRNPLYSNILRSLAIPLALVAALVTGNLVAVVMVGIGGEVVAALASGLLARFRVGLGERHYMFCLGLALLCMASAIAAVWVSALALVVLLPALLMLTAICFAALRKEKLRFGPGLRA